ncbi:glutathione S-transferase N-terminal domain-containing protein [Vibrio sp. DW001]|uniref:glutathione S-transferase family protein n=1 Tax=Vibrio sp. DW001 TaxID=2912315 RepID=UPI0023B0244E|nr:glutathione S-transferase N-terminal domain-containing protein [Vibrio sp. DW001]WED25594.1 glutathione S-transferase N-terminal domain-containing protein [Vibrio sp. DW001]
MENVILYSAIGSNSSERVEWVLNFKGITYSRVEVESSELKTSFLAINPFGYVPVISIDGYLISESIAIIECVEELNPSPSILGKHWEESASIREICEYVNSTIHAPQNRTVLSTLRPELSESAKKEFRGNWMTHTLAILSSRLWLVSDYAVGGDFSLADIFVATVYKKARQHGAKPIRKFEQHLDWLRGHKLIAASEPK